MAGLGRRRHLWSAAAAACVALAVYFVLTGLGVGDKSMGAGTRESSPAARPFASFSLESPHVLSSYSTYSVRGLGSDMAPSPASTLPAMSPSGLDRPIAAYRRYTVAQLGLMEAQIARLEQALAANDRVASKSAWSAAYACYLRLGGVYLVGRVATLNDAIDGTPGGLAGGVSSPRFEGLHRIEYGLWNGRQPRALLGWAKRLDSSVRRLRALLPGVSITALEYGTRAHEILEDAQRDLLSGADVPWSGEGVLGTEAGLTATEEIVLTLHPFLADEDSESGQDYIAPTIDAELAALRAVMGTLAREHGGRLPTIQQLSKRQSELLDGTLGGTLEALSRVPVVLEAETPLAATKIPAREKRIDP